MEDQHVIAGTRRIFPVHAGEGVMACAGDMFARVLVSLTYVNKDRAAAHQFGGSRR
jgi:hypothetical protein